MSELYADEGWNPSAQSLDFTGLEGTNSYCSDEAARAISSALSERKLPMLRWIDSGDYHYLSYLLAKDIREPFGLLLLDHHSDCQDSAFGSDILSCGNWVEFLRRACPALKSVEWNVLDPIADELPVYVSLDLDVLSEKYFRTNWDQGSMTPTELETILTKAFRRRVLAIDICGGLSVAKGADAASLSQNFRFREWLSEQLLAKITRVFG